MNEAMQDFRYALPGCRGTNCAHRLQDTLNTVEHGYVRVFGGYSGRLTTNEIIPHCAKAQARSQYRKQIFTNAKAAIEHAGAGYTTLRGQLKAEREAWYAESRKWWDEPCPFFEPLDDPAKEDHGDTIET